MVRVATFFGMAFGAFIFWQTMDKVHVWIALHQDEKSQRSGVVLQELGLNQPEVHLIAGSSRKRVTALFPDLSNCKHSCSPDRFNGTLSREDEEMSRSALSTFRAKEEEIEKKKLEVRERVQAQLGRIEEETKHLANIRECQGEFFMVSAEEDEIERLIQGSRALKEKATELQKKIENAGGEN